MRKWSPGLALLLLLTALAAGPTSAADVRYTVPEEGSATVGPKSAPVTIIEFVDYQ
jgi:protein-disulfide isomerase